ncbi:PEP7 [Candida oxycetoniae]|uniref:PEP7 n=1 Tax=Candida oxycetoniae TaxID=497107 RepID=A0AAI9WW40_9ASCO|nr:PEP7 [Candida oxycetoniae]KAI3402632.2 PEP7 [Candida oxycetoniae]
MVEFKQGAEQRQGRLNEDANGSISPQLQHTSPQSSPPLLLRSTPTKKINKITFSEHGFSIGDTRRIREESPSNRITTQHWKSQQQQQFLKCKLCDKQLNVKNGIVNCRKCGDLYCNEHTHFQVKLRNPVKGEVYPQFDSSNQGVWSRCCQTCFTERRHTEVNFVDITNQLVTKRREQNDQKQLHRTKIQRNFIKLTNLMVEKSQNKQGSLFSRFYTFVDVDDDEKNIIGVNNWIPDSDATNCTICFTKFNILIRKHHCRLCGEVVCDDSYGVRKKCSMFIPLVFVIKKLPNLNYSKLVRTHWDNIDEKLRFRCCINCYNSILYTWKRDHHGNGVHEAEDVILASYESMLLQKQLIETMMSLYETGNNTPENNAKIGHKLTTYLKHFENSILQFKSNFFYKNKDHEKIFVRHQYQSSERILLNIYQSVVTFLQENLIKFKAINEKNQPNVEEVTLKVESPAVPTTSLTKKQIRELREQLMVLNEQKFLVENQILEFTKNRKFDELNTLVSNKNEILETIKKLEEELGEYGF